MECRRTRKYLSGQNIFDAECAFNNRSMYVGVGADLWGFFARMYAENHFQSKSENFINKLIWDLNWFLLHKSKSNILSL